MDSLKETLEKSPAVKDHYSIRSSGTQILSREDLTISGAKSLIHHLLSSDPAEVLEEVKISKLRGRGGAGFPLGIKLDTCRNQSVHPKFVICNGDEGDPGAFTDRFLLEERPIMVILGLLIAGYIIGSDRGVIYIRGEYPESTQIIDKTIEELKSHGLLGENILDSDFTFSIKVIQALGSYLCGEETALINSIEGQRPEVRIRPPYPAEKGLFQRPTLVNNVETLANLPFIIEKGGKHFASIGNTRSTGTKLISLDSHFHIPGVCEVEMGYPLNQVVSDLGGGFRRPVKALHIGGPLGGVVPLHQVQNLHVNFESFSESGFLLGHASIVSIPESMPMIRYIEHLFAFAAHESCGKCFPCRLGTKRAQEMFRLACESDYRIDTILLRDLLDTLEKTSLCAHGGGIPLPVRNILTHFAEEVEPFFITET